MPMTPTRKRLLLWSVPALLLAAAMAWLLAPRPVPVDLARAAVGPLTVTVEAEGETRVRDVFTVSAPVAGRMQRLAVEVGDVVEDGAPVAVIRPADPVFLDARTATAAVAGVRAAEAAVAGARAEVARAESDLSFARSELDRARRLAEEGTIPRRSLERAQADFSAGTAALEAARDALRAREAELEAARAGLIQPGEPQSLDAAEAAPDTCCVHVPAPASGRVLAVLQESEAVVQAGQPLLEIGDPRALEVTVDLLSSDAVQVRPGMAATLVDWGGAPLNGVVRRVDPSGFTEVSALGIEEQRVNVIIDPADGSRWPESLGHAFRVVAQIAVWHSDEVLTVPMGAVFRDAAGWAVFRVEDGTARHRPVTLGRMEGLTAQVTAGLAEGDSVVLHPGDRVAPGTSVTARETEG
ncbi:hypothetical protein C882_0658 [Caenispirillum salinarum AK4]|uniref:YknX-like C-terminal permuted SH3-like domain-containing protein n=2 Tax=Caenispirillum TaxID=414051 RepID=K9GSC4_9PROT|nr:hypothetical protein C882_0658 [Caenispirillum salinarum AK4]